MLVKSALGISNSLYIQHFEISTDRNFPNLYLSHNDDFLYTKKA